MRPSATLRAASFPAWALLNLGQGEPQAAVEEQALDQVRTLDRFLVSVEKRAFRIARIAVRHDDDALDIVQDAMLQLARRYAQRPSEEWRPLFYRILQNRVRDYQRRQKVRGKLMSWLPSWKTDEDEAAAPRGKCDTRPTTSAAEVNPAERRCSTLLGQVVSAPFQPRRPTAANSQWNNGEL